MATMVWSDGLSLIGSTSASRRRPPILVLDSMNLFSSVRTRMTSGRTFAPPLPTLLTITLIDASHCVRHSTLIGVRHSFRGSNFRLRRLGWRNLTRRPCRDGYFFFPFFPDKVVTIINWLIGPWSAVAIEADGSTTLMQFGPHLPRPE